jgi:hypothetical protein
MIRILSYLLIGFWCVSPATAYTNLGETCPDRFQIVDLGIRVHDNLGPTPHRYGGILIDAGIQDKSEDYLTNSRIDCAVLPDKNATIPYRNGLPIALGASTSLRTLKLRFLAGVSIGNLGSAEHAYKITEGRRAEIFAAWVSNRKIDSEIVSSGSHHTCLYDLSNPELTGEGNYACLLTIQGMPNPNTFINCNKWRGCFAEFTSYDGLSFRISVPLPKEMSVAEVPRGPLEVAQFWNDFVLSFKSTFEDAIIPRDDQIILREKLWHFK